jgi:hypothetical protein
MFAIRVERRLMVPGGSPMPNHSVRWHSYGTIRAAKLWRNATPGNDAWVKPLAGFQATYIFFDDLYVTDLSGIKSGRKTGFTRRTYPFEESPLMQLRILAALPFIGILLGVPFVNRVEPLVLGMPFVLAWIVLWVILISVIMGLIYRFDPSNRQACADTEETRS